MIRDITIGQYYPAQSPVHRLDPRTKVIATMVYLVSLFCFENMWGYVAAGLFFVAVVRLSGVPFRFLLRGLKPMVMLILFTAALNMFWTPGTVLFHVGIIKITREGLWRGAFLVFRLILLIVGSSVMTLTTTPNQLTDAFERLMSPLQRFRVPVAEIALMMSIALRFIPILMEETDRIMKAQTARGADFTSGHLLHRMRQMIPLLVPLFVSAARRAGDLACAMDARCYHGGAGRTKMKPLKFGRHDVTAAAVVFMYLVILAVVVHWT